MLTSLAYVALGVVLALAGGWALKKYLPKGRPSLATLRRELMRLTHDAGVTERLLEAERKRHPELSELAVLQRVIRRLRRDRGR